MDNERFRKLAGLAPLQEAVDTALEKELTKIASKHLDIETLKTRSSDSLDFYDVSVWGVKTALKAAYDLGMKAAKDEQDKSK